MGRRCLEKSAPEPAGRLYTRVTRPLNDTAHAPVSYTATEFSDMVPCLLPRGVCVRGLSFGRAFWERACELANARELALALVSRTPQQGRHVLAARQ